MFRRRHLRAHLRQHRKDGSYIPLKYSPEWTLTGKLSNPAEPLDLLLSIVSRPPTRTKEGPRSESR